MRRSPNLRSKSSPRFRLGNKTPEARTRPASAGNSLQELQEGLQATGPLDPGWTTLMAEDGRTFFWNGKTPHPLAPIVLPRSLQPCETDPAADPPTRPQTSHPNPTTLVPFNRIRSTRRARTEATGVTTWARPSTQRQPERGLAPRPASAPPIECASLLPPTEPPAATSYDSPRHKRSGALATYSPQPPEAELPPPKAVRRAETLPAYDRAFLSLAGGGGAATVPSPPRPSSPRSGNLSISQRISALVGQPGPSVTHMPCAPDAHTMHALCMHHAHTCIPTVTVHTTGLASNRHKAEVTCRTTGSSQRVSAVSTPRGTATGAHEEIMDICSIYTAHTDREGPARNARLFVTSCLATAAQK